MLHSELVRVLVKPGDVILSELTPREVHLIHMTMGICGEAGELLDAVKKMVIYRKELDMENVREELGDLEFYQEGFRQTIGLSREEILEQNIRKLSKRYNGVQYSDAAAIQRADKE